MRIETCEHVNRRPNYEGLAALHKYVLLTILYYVHRGCVYFNSFIRAFDYIRHFEDMS